MLSGKCFNPESKIRREKLNVNWISKCCISKSKVTRKISLEAKKTGIFFSMIANTGTFRHR